LGRLLKILRKRILRKGNIPLTVVILILSVFAADEVQRKGVADLLSEEIGELVAGVSAVLDTD
jgi:hypothetical protein